MYKKTSMIFLLFAALTLPACTTLPVVRPNPLNSIRTVAVLPMTNNTVDLDGPVVVRALFAANLENFFYAVKPLEEVDLVLKNQMGVTLGSQLEMAATGQLCDALGVDAIVYGSLDDFNQKITGIYNSKRVRVRVRMDSCKTGEILWKNGAGVKRETRATDSMAKSIPVLGTAITAAGAVASIASSWSDRNDTELPKLHGEEIKAPWEDISDADSTAELGLLAGIGGRVLGKALEHPLLVETEVAVNILLQGYYDDGADLIPYGKMLPAGPVAPPARQAVVQ